MNSLVNLLVDKTTESTKGGFIVTLKTDVENREPVVVQTALGSQTRYPKMRTYYTKVNEDLEIGTKVELDLDDYDIVEHPFTTEDGKDITCKWLYLK